VVLGRSSLRSTGLANGQQGWQCTSAMLLATRKGCVPKTTAPLHWTPSGVNPHPQPSGCPGLTTSGSGQSPRRSLREWFTQQWFKEDRMQDRAIYYSPRQTRRRTALTCAKFASVDINYVRIVYKRLRAAGESPSNARRLILIIGHGQGAA
jgi:hypothetical protein